MGMLLRERMMEDLKLRNRSAITQRCYLSCARRFAERFPGRPPSTLGEPEIRQFLMELVERGASPATHHQHVAALKFLYAITLRKPDVVA
jgi:hypothetical protein